MTSWAEDLMREADFAHKMAEITQHFDPCEAQINKLMAHKVVCAEKQIKWQNELKKKCGES